MRAFGIVALLVALATPARADESETILVISGDRAFQSDVSEALAPATVQVGEDPPPSIENITTASRAIVDREHATAAVWLLFADSGATLVVYDRGVDRVLVRSLPYATPLAHAQAIETARVTRTMLRALRVEDPHPEPPPPPPPLEIPDEPRVIATTPSEPESTIALELSGGVRLRAPGTTAAAGGEVAAIWRPDQVGLGVGLRLAPAADLDGVLSGRISDQSVAATLRLPLPVSRRVGVTTAVGGALHRIALSGSFDTMDVSSTRYDPAVRLGVIGSYAVNSRIGLGFGVSADWLLRRQSYESSDTALLEVPSIQVALGVALLARIL